MSVAHHNVFKFFYSAPGTAGSTRSLSQLLFGCIESAVEAVSERERELSEWLFQPSKSLFLPIQYALSSLFLFFLCAGNLNKLHSARF